MSGFIVLAIIIGFIVISAIKSLKKSTQYKSNYKPSGDGYKIETEVIICINKECQQELRIPKSDRKLTITCPTCNRSFSHSPISTIAEKGIVKPPPYTNVEPKATTPKHIRIIKSVSDGFTDIPEHRRVSISKIKDSSCPFKYFKNYIEEPKEEKPFLSIELGLGQYFHSKVERLFKTIAAQQRLIKKDDILNTDSIINEFEISFMWNKRLREPYKIIRYNFDYFKNRLANIINNFNKNVIPRLTNHKVLKTEGNLEIKIDEYAIRGKYDLLTQDQNNRLSLWDWKTGAAPKPNFYEEFTLQKIQLGIYAIWIRYKYDSNNVLANAVFLRDNTYFLQEVFEYPIEKRVIDYIDNEYRYLKSITSYVPIPNNLCEWCSWNRKCSK